MPTMHIVNTTLPVFLIIAFGAILQRAGFLPAEFVKTTNRLTYWVGLPCLLFYKVAVATYDFNIAGRTFVVVLAGMIASIAVGYVLTFILRIPWSSAGTFVQGAYRGNLVYVGLSVIIYSFANSKDFDSARMETIAVLVIAMMVPLYNIAAVVILLGSQHKIDRHVPGRILRQIATNPLFLACVCGIMYSLTFSVLPKVAGRTLESLGQIALPLALLGIGATLGKGKVAGSFRASFVSSLIKTGFAPSVGLLAGIFLGLGPGEMRIALLLLACPTAAASYIMTEQLGGDGPLSAGIVVVSSVLSAVSMSLVVGFF